VRVLEPTLPTAPRVWRGRDILLMTVLSLTLFFTLVAAAVVMLIFTTGVDPLDEAALMAQIGSLPGVLSMSAASVIALVAGVLGVSAWRKRGAADLGLRPVTGRLVLLSIAAAVGLRLLFFPLAALLTALGLPSTTMQTAFIAPVGFDLGALLGVLLFVGVLIPIAEELFFRGALYVWLRERWGVPIATIVSSLVFGAVHGELTIGILMISLGALTAIAYQRSGSLWTSIIIHVVFNTLGILIVYAFLAAA
jgi:uncharacterized protein